jgi:hypothetical protein
LAPIQFVTSERMPQVGKTSANDMTAAGAKQIDPYEVSTCTVAAEDPPHASSARARIALRRDGHFSGASMSCGEVQVEFALFSQANAAACEILLGDICFSATRHDIAQVVSHGVIGGDQ